MSGMWDPWTADHERLADEFDRFTGITSATGRTYDDDEDDGMTAEERALAAQLDAYLAKPSREDDEAAERRARRDYSNLDAEGVSLALRLDQLTGVRP